jgi:MarR family transcriptional regulator, lower aerobic nicotinate degradation pathway regulator
MTKYKLIEELLPILAAYELEKTEEEESVNNFARWIVQKEKENLFTELTVAKGESQTALQMRFVDNARLLVRMYRYAKMYGKKVIPNESPISFEDYSYLVPLYYMGKMTKMQLIQQNVHEKSTGMEIIKRLQKTGMIEQEDNDIDKRSKHIFLTEKGKVEMDKIQSAMWKLTADVNGNLTSTETHTLYQLLEKLDFFHNEVFCK